MDNFERVTAPKGLLARRNRIPGFFGPNDGSFKPTRVHLDRAFDIVCAFEGWFDDEWFPLGRDAVLNIYRIPEAGLYAATIHPASVTEDGKAVINYKLWNHIVMIAVKKQAPIKKVAGGAK